MDKYDDILRALGRIEGQLVEIQKLSDRVWILERWQNWLKGAWVILAGGYAYLFRAIYGK